MKGVSIILRLLAAALLIAASSPLARAQQAPLQDKPFAEHKVVLQLSDKSVRTTSPPPHRCRSASPRFCC
jgi:hypothetical protein